jgi:hypothetical protein
MDGSIYGIKNQTTIDHTGSSPDSAKSAPTTKKEVDDHSDYHHRLTLYGSTIPYSPMVAQIPFVTEAKKGKGCQDIAPSQGERQTKAYAT